MGADFLQPHSTSRGFGAPGVIYACEEGRLHASRDAGETWSALAPLPAGFAVGRPRVAPSNPKVIYVIASTKEGPPNMDAILRSDDGGASWRAVRPATGVVVEDLVVSPASPDVAYATSWAFDKSGSGVDYGESGVVKTEDGGKTWRNTFRAAP